MNRNANRLPASRQRIMAAMLIGCSTWVAASWPGLLGAGIAALVSTAQPTPAQAQRSAPAANVKALNAKVARLYRAGKFREAIAVGRRALAAAQTAFGPDDRRTATPLNNLAVILKSQGRYAEAEPLYKRSLAIRKTKLGKDHPLVGQSLNNLAELYRAQGRYAEAEPLYKRSLAIYEAALGKTHPEVATTLNNLAGLYKAQGRYAEAEPLYKRDLAIRKTKLGKDHPLVGQSLNNLAELYRAQGRYAEAEPLYKRDLAINEAALGKTHPSVATTLNNLAGLYKAQGRYAEAEPLYKRALGLWRHHYGPHHPHIAIGLGNLAGLYDKMKRNNDAARVRARLALLPTAGTRHVSLYFATNRKAVPGTAGRTLRFGSEDGEQLTLGRVVMQVGKKQVGSRALELLKRTRKSLTAADNLKVMRVKRLTSAKIFAGSAMANMHRAANFKNQALVVVHGYNVNFNEAMQRAAQIAFDTQFDGVVIPFTWPSKRRLRDYLKDTVSADVSVDYLVQLLDVLDKHMPGVKVHFVAHSIGNVVLLRALERIAERRSGTRPNFGEVILAHADVEVRRCRQLLRNARPIVAGMTLYVNKHDWALKASKLLRGARCGNGVHVFDGVDTIDTSGMGQGKSLWRMIKSLGRKLNHDVFVRNPLLFGEIRRLLLTGQRPPHERTVELRAHKTGDGKTFWRYDPKLDVALQAKEALRK